MTNLLNSLKLKIQGNSHRDGFSVVSALVGIALTTMMISFAADNLSMHLKSINSTQMKGDKEWIRRMLLDQTSCLDTAGADLATKCAANGGLVPLMKRSNSGITSELVGIAGKKIGFWTVRAQCNAANDGVEIRASRLKPGALPSSVDDIDYYTDPLTEKRIPRFDEAASNLFPSGTELCASAPSTSQVVTGAYQGTGNWNSWTSNTAVKSIHLGFKPSTVSIRAMPLGDGYAFVQFGAEKTVTMPGWQSILTFLGVNYPVGGAYDNYYASVLITDTGFEVRKAMNLLPAYYNVATWPFEYQYVAQR